MSRTKRSKQLWPADRDAFVAVATDFHKRVTRLQAEIAINGSDYKALASLHDELCRAVRTITGDETLPWVTIATHKPGVMVP